MKTSKEEVKNKVEVKNVIYFETVVLCVQEVVTHFIQYSYYIKQVTSSWTHSNSTSSHNFRHYQCPVKTQLQHTYENWTGLLGHTVCPRSSDPF